MASRASSRSATWRCWCPCRSDALPRRLPSSRPEGRPAGHGVAGPEGRREAGTLFTLAPSHRGGGRLGSVRPPATPPAAPGGADTTVLSETLTSPRPSRAWALGWALPSPIRRPLFPARPGSDVCLGRAPCLSFPTTPPPRPPLGGLTPSLNPTPEPPPPGSRPQGAPPKHTERFSRARAAPTPTPHTGPRGPSLHSAKAKHKGSEEPTSPHPRLLGPRWGRDLGAHPHQQRPWPSPPDQQGPSHTRFPSCLIQKLAKRGPQAWFTFPSGDPAKPPGHQAVLVPRAPSWLLRGEAWMSRLRRATWPPSQSRAD